jgi:hypothetical protein
MKITNVGYMQHGKHTDYRSGSIVVPVGATVEVPQEYAQHLLKTFPGMLVGTDPRPAMGTTITIAPISAESAASIVASSKAAKRAMKHAPKDY